jgi:hypothetical protein
MKRPTQTKYQWLGDLLGAFGRDAITREHFWVQMKARGYTQDDIDRWCDEYHRLTNSKEQA